MRKTLLALAIASNALPAHATHVQLTDSGYVDWFGAHNDGLTISGAFTGAQQTAILLGGTRITGDLVLDSTISNTYEYARGLGDFGWSNHISGNFVNKGNITSQGYSANALEVGSSFVGGDVINQGRLSASGESASALETAEMSHIERNLINGAGGRLQASGEQSRGIRLRGYLEGQLINQGVISVSGTNSAAIELAPPLNPIFGPLPSAITQLSGIQNHGTLIARGDGAQGIRVDTVHLLRTTATPNARIVNTGTIDTSASAIHIGNLMGDAGGWFAHEELNIDNSGNLISATRAVDASESDAMVRLHLLDGSKVVGNLIDLSEVTVSGNVSFTATGSDTPHIRIGEPLWPGYDGWLDIGTPAGQPTHFVLGAPHTVIDSNVYLSSASTLDLNLSSATDPSRPVVTISKTLQVADGAQIRLAAQGRDFNANGNTYRIIQAGDIELLDQHDQPDPNGRLDVVSASALLKIDSYTLSDDQLTATVTGKGQDELSELLTRQGASANGYRALSSLVQGNILGQLNGTDPLLLAATSIDEAQLARLAEQLAPDVSDGARQAATASQRLITNVTLNRTSGLRGVASGDTLKDTGVWVQTLYSDATQQRRDGIAGYNAYSRGIAVGADGKLDDQLTLGVAYSFIDTNVNGRSGSKTDVEGHAFTLYGGYELGNYFVDGNLTYGFNDNDGKRDIAGTRAKSDYDSKQLGLNLIAGYTWQASSQWLVEPRLAARYNRVDIDGYKEKGSSAALKIEDQRYEAIELGAGVRLAGSYAFGAGTLEPQFKLMTYHDFAADKVQNTSTFLVGGTPFVTSGASTARNSYEAGVGADYKLGAVTVGLNYDYVGKSGFDADVFSAKVRYDF